MKEWFLRQAPKDRLIVIAGAILLAIVLLYAILWYPISSSIDSRRSAIESKTKSLVFLKQGAAQIKSLGAGGGTAKSSDKAPYQLISQVIDELGAGLPERVEPVGSDKARVQFSNVSFDKLVAVIAELELYSVTVDTANLTRKDEAGMVSARLTMVQE